MRIRRSASRVGRAVRRARSSMALRRAVEARARRLRDEDAQPVPVRVLAGRGGEALAELGPVAGHDVGGQHPAVAHAAAAGGRDHPDDLTGAGARDRGAAEPGLQGLTVSVPRLQLDPLAADQLGGGGSVFGECPSS
ncbi:hypothetical protein [Streptomyces sp. NBC_00009]|uniref:hypothetical protein n=1 Tax=Streptomyces sp. NBC_00009 TaxID=2975620 RepID=UPI003252D733